MALLRREKAKKTLINQTRMDIRLQGPALFLARAIWLTFALSFLILFILDLFAPLFGSQTSICPGTFTCNPYDTGTLQALKHLQIPLATYTIYVTVFGLIYGLIFIGIGVLMFWRLSNHLVALLASFAFLALGAGGLVPGDPSKVPFIFYLVSLVSTNCMEICLGFFFVTFPDGRFIPRWSWLIGCTLVMQAFFFELPGPLNILSWPLPILVCELVLAYGSPIVVQVYRYRYASSPAQRQQTKWVLFGLVSYLLVIFAGFFGGFFFSSLDLYQLIVESLASLGFLFLPLSISVAIMRSKLWDIDAIINRTLVYGLLTLILALVYLGLVFGGETLLVGIIGKNNGIVIVSSTLIAVTLFQPLRRGIQNVIDQRFYRQKYNAQRTLQAFSTTLHNEIDLAHLNEHLVAVVQETMQPAHASLWLFKSQHPSFPLERKTKDDLQSLTGDFM